MRYLLITCGVSPDLDGFACGIGYAEYLSQKNLDRKYYYGFETAGQIETRFASQYFKQQDYLLQDHVSYDEFILVDACQQYGLPPILDPKKTIEVIDHRLFPDYTYFPNAKFQIEPVGAAATQIAEKYYFDDLIPNPVTSSLLLGAIYSNTLYFLSDTTNFRDFRMKKWLESLDGVDVSFPQYMFQYKTSYIKNNLRESLLLDLKQSNNLSFFNWRCMIPRVCSKQRISLMH